MPIYEYECEKCKKVFEVIQSVSAQDTPPCPQCGHPRTKRLVSACAAGFGEKSADLGGFSPSQGCGSSSGFS